MNYAYQLSSIGAIAGFVGSFVGYGLLVAKGVSSLAVLVIFSGLCTVAMVLFAPIVTIFVLRISAGLPGTPTLLTAL